ncbi:PREDICTED: apolipophorins [Trachymyrmex septentrionalis]|uniref:apolipophorins n=1 Tax=Trachymyrmex septentrionalis TaxID=34720 RepID=UPI00084F0B32|nr:PREDICTED: apolipophorins [Trachymyrmex septentrionalis]
MGLARATVFAGCLLLFLTVDASGNKCTVGCHGMHGGKGYQEGHTYIYDLEGTSVTSVPDAQGDATLKLKGTVELSVKPDCIRQIRLKGVQINGAPISLPDVEKHALQFNYHDGHIDTEVCTEAGDSQASLNIKRAVTSLFQSAIIQESGSTTHHEIDVLGGCPTDFSFHKDGDSLVIHKERDLLRCSYRESIRIGPVSAIYESQKSDAQSAPLLSSHQKIEQRFKRGILNKATSVETYKLKPWSNGDIGAKTIVQTTLTLKGEKGDSPNAPVSEPKSLIFETPHPVVKSSVDSIAAALKAASAEEHDSVKHDAAEKFAQLVKVLRLSSKNDIFAIYQKVKNGNGFDKVLDKKIFLDGLFRTGSGEAAEVVADLLKSHELTDVQTLIFYASLALVNHVNLPSVTAVTSLLDQPNLPRLGYLGIGQVIGRHCQEHNCENVAEVKQAVHKIREKVGNGKAKTREQENIIVSALKALGNTQYLDDATLQKLASIAEDKNVRNRVRVAAIESLPTRCSMKWKNILLKVLADREEDSEIRIKSYLSLVACPCQHVVNGLKETLDKETVNQVGSFIQSHLRNLRASADPTKAEAKRHLGQIKPRTKFPEDFRKFSFNTELSYDLGGIGIGDTLESNVIYSQHSFVPRSINLNLTTEIFGRSYNYLELNTRIENLDRLIEHYFGPKGRLTDNEVDELVDKGVDNAESIAKYIKEKVSKLRSKREVKQGELDKFAKGVKLRNNEVDQQLDFDLSVKLFGVELAYLTYDGNPAQLTPEHIIDKIFDNLEDGINKIKKFDHNLQSHMQFFDVEVIYPTNLGTALSLDVIGTSVVHIKTHGKIDVPAIIKNPNNAEIHFGLAPSASIRVSASMVVKGFDVESGMKFVSTLHTDTATDLTVKLLNGKGIDITVGAPKKKEEIVSVSSEVLLSSGDTYKAAKFGKGKLYKDCFEQLSSILGITVCGHVEFPYDGIESTQKRALFPLNGPSKFSITSENIDLSSVHLKIYHDKSPKSRSFEILLETPNSKTNRHVSLTGEVGLEPNKHAKLSFDSPFKKASVEAVIKEEPQERSLTVTMHNDNQEYYGRVGLLANGAKYKPILEYKVPEHIERLANTKSGLKSSRGGQQYEVQGTVEVVDQDDGKKYVFDKVALVAGGQKLVGLDGYVQSAENTAGLDMKVSYGEESVALKLQGKKKEDRYYSISASALPSKDPNIGFNIQSELEKDVYEYKYNLIFIHGPDQNSKTNRFSLEHHAIAKPNKDGQNFVVGSSTKISYPAAKLKLELAGKAKPNSLEGEIEIGYEKFKFGSKLCAEQNKVKTGDYEIEFEGELLQNSIKLESKRTIVDAHKSKYKNKLELIPGGKYEADALVTYNHDKNNKNLNFELDSDLKLDDKKVKVFGSLNVERSNIQSQAYVTVSDVKYVDFLLKLQQQGANPQGSLILNAKSYLNVAGQMSMQNGKGNAQLNIDLPKINRKIKGTGDFTVSGTQHNGNFEFLLDVEKDPKKRIKLSTANDIKKNAIDTKNVIEIMNYKFELNGKGKLDGTIHEGELTVGTDVTLPSGRYLVANFKHTSKKDENQKYTIHMDGQLEDHESKGGKSRKLTYVDDITDFDWKANTFLKNMQLKAVDLNGDHGQLDLGLKNLIDTDGHKKVEGINLNLSGSRMSRPFNLQYEATEDNNGKLSYKGSSSCGKDFKLKSSGNYIPSNYVDKPYTIEGNAELILPSEKLRNIKFDYSQNALVQFESTGLINYLDLKDSMTLTYNDDKSIKSNRIFKSSGIYDGEHPYDSDLQFDLTILKIPPISFKNYFKYEPNDDKATLTTNTIAKYDQKEITFALNPVIYNRDLTHIDIKAKATTPYEKLHSIDLELKHERQKDGQGRKTDAALTLDNTKYTLKSEIQSGNISPMIHIISTCPAGKTELLSKFNKIGDREYTGEWKVETPKGFAVADAHVNLNGIDDFMININLDSDKLKHRKIHAEIANKPTAKTGRRIIITVTSDGKNIVTGSTNYKKRDEAGKITIEGNGNLKIGEDTKSSSFKYTRQQLTREKDGESGVLIVLNAKFDPVAIVGELKLSNKEVLVFNSYCELSKDCAHFKLQSSYDADNKNNVDHELTVEVDLKKFNVPVEFGLKTNTVVKDSKLDHSANLYLHSSKDNSQYSYKVYAHPKESAVILTLPSRELAVIGTFDLPKTKQTGAFKVDVSVYLDRKNKPSDKTGLTANGDINIEKNSGSISGEVKFIYPSQPKDMAVKGKLHYGGDHLLDANVDIDVFAKKTQKINVVAKLNRQNLDKGHNITSVIEVNSRGQQLKVDLKSHLAVSDSQFGFGSMLSYTDVHQKPKSLGVLFSANYKEAHLLVTSPNKELLKFDTKLQFNNNLQKFDSEIVIVGNKPIVVNFEAHDFNSFTYSEYQDNPNTKLIIEGRVVLGQLAEIHADAFKAGEKKNLFHSLIHLDEEKFLKPDFGYNKDNVIHALEYYRSRSIGLLKQFKDVSNDISNEAERELKDLVEHLKKAQPNFKSLSDYYETELNKLKNELQADQTIKDIQATFNKYFGAIIQAIRDSLNQITVRLNELEKEYAEVVSKLEEAWNTVYPQLKDSYNKIANAYINFIDNVANVSMAYLKTLLTVVNEHQKELKELAIVVSEIAQDIAKIVFKAFAQIKKDIEEFINLLKNQMKALPIFDIAKQQYQDILNLKIPETVLASIHELSEVIKSMLPTEELRQLFSATYEYIMKHVKHEKVDNSSEIKKIYNHMLDAIASLIKLLKSSGSLDSLIDDLFNTHLPAEFEMLSKLPVITSFKVSLVNLIRNNELPSLMDLYYTYRPTLLLSDIVPPFSKVGIVIDGGHIFTFDGNHLSMPGDCTYILAQDMQDGNFSVVANFNKGNLVSVTVTEPKESITLKNNGNILVNNKPADFPANTKNLHAFLVVSTPNVKSDYGVHVLCSPKHSAMLCMVRVSGFYHGKLRGLFGDGNNEYYDDYTLPSGKITESETEFANGYKLKPDCPAVNAIDHKTKQRNPVCTDYFSGQKSTLKNCFNYVNPTHYRDACDVAANGNPQAPCLLASAYYANCYYKRVSGINIPSTCINCKVGENTVAIGDTFSVKTPKNQADIIIVIEQVEANEKIFKDLIPTLITDLREELKQHGITDVHIGLIGFGEHMKWPQHYTSNGNINIEGEVKNMKFEESEPIITFEEAKKGDYEKQVTYLEQRINLELGALKLTDAYEEAINYPFRPGAVKAVVAVFASPCEKSPLPLSLQQLRLLLGLKVYRDLGLGYYQVYYTNDIQVSGKVQKNIVGFDSDSVYVFADSKKKPLSGNTDLKSNMVLSSVDVCADFAIASGGTVFSSNNFIDAKPNQKRQFAQITARKIAEDLTNVEMEKDCVCNQYHIFGRAHCKIVGRKEKEQLARHTKGGVKG